LPWRIFTRKLETLIKGKNNLALATPSWRPVGGFSLQIPCGFFSGFFVGFSSYMIMDCLWRLLFRI